MTTKLSDKLNIEMDPPYLAGRACATCKHYTRDDSWNGFNRCGFYGMHVITAQHSHLCGNLHKNWEPIPPSLGIFGHIKRLLWGSK